MKFTTWHFSGNVGRLDVRTLNAAFDAQRCERRVTWAQGATEIGVSPSTFTWARLRGRMEVDGMLAMARWLGRTVESFARGATRKQR